MFLAILPPPFLEEFFPSSFTRLAAFSPFIFLSLLTDLMGNKLPSKLEGEEEGKKTRSAGSLSVGFGLLELMQFAAATTQSVRLCGAKRRRGGRKQIAKTIWAQVGWQKVNSPLRVPFSSPPPPPVRQLS